MKLSQISFFTILLFLILTITSLTSCSRPPLEPEALEKIPEPVEVRSSYGTLEELFQTEVINMGLRELGYRVIPGTEVEYQFLHEAIAKGYLDYTASHWHILHTKYRQEGMKEVGTLIENALQGYLIDRKIAQEYEIFNIKDLQNPQIAELFDSDGDSKANLVGCNPGWGCERIIEHHLDAYNLRETVEHDKGNYSALVDEMLDRFERGEPILYYTWTPYWLNETLQPEQEVIWLEVPYTDLPEEQQVIEEINTTFQGKNLGFPIDTIGILANEQFLNENPVARHFFELTTIPVDDINAQNQLMKKGENTPKAIRSHAQEWKINNEKTFNNWLQEARKKVNGSI